MNLVHVISEGAVHRGEDGKPFAFAWQQGEDSKHGADGRGRSWIVRAGDYAGSLSATKVDAVCIPDTVVGPLQSRQGDPRLDADSAGAGLYIPVMPQGFGTNGQSARHSDRITLSASDDNGSNAVCVTGERMSALTTEGADASEDGTGRGTPIVFDTAQITSNVNRTRVEPGLPSSTPASNSNMHTAGTFGVRRLMPIECERLQGLPDDFCRQGADGKKLSDTARYRMIGNGGAVPVLEWIARRIAAALALAVEESA